VREQDAGDGRARRRGPAHAEAAAVYLRARRRRLLPLDDLDVDFNFDDGTTRGWSSPGMAAHISLTHYHQGNYSNANVKLTNPIH
jgi:hypothetical protein